jgi:hypothetical protein
MSVRLPLGDFYWRYPLGQLDALRYAEVVEDQSASS